MPAESDPKRTLNEFQKPRQGWLAKCGILIPSLSKRKRASSPGSARIPVKVEKPGNMDITTFNQGARDTFDMALRDEAALGDYLENRKRLLDKESEIAWDRNMRPKDPEHMSPDEQIERRVDQIMRGIKEYERDVIFGDKAGEDLPGPDTRDMGGQFLTNKDRIEQESKLYRIAKLVPKGALLHLHFNAELHPERLLEEARTMRNMYIRSIRPLLTEEDLDLTEMVFNVLPLSTKSEDIFARGYQGARFKRATNVDPVWMRWSEFRNKFEEKFGHKYTQTPETPAEKAMNGKRRTCSEPGHVTLKPAENWIKSKMVLSKEEAYGPTQTLNSVWARFNQATRCFKGLLNYERVYRWYIGQAIDRMIEEKVMYAELRPMLLDKSIPNDDGVPGILTNRKQMELIIEEVKRKQEQLRQENRLDSFPYGLKMVYCTPRSISGALMEREMQQCIELKLEFPDLICGFDLVGAEDRPNHIGFYAKQLLAFRNACEKLDIDIPFLFHAGETLLDTGGSTDPSNSNLYDAVLLKSKRIGHGFSLMKHPELIQYFRKGYQEVEIDEENKQGGRKEQDGGKLRDGKEKVKVFNPGICIELCPISNELLHLCRNIKEHPYPELLAAGIPCTVNSDNPSLFSNSMSHEFYQVMVGAPTMSIYGWKQLAYWSIEYSCLSDAEKKHARGIYDQAWKEFCTKVVQDYGNLLNGDLFDRDEANKVYGVSAAS